MKAVYAGRRVEALGRLDTLDAELRDRRDVLAPPSYGRADVVWTVFLARMRFIRMGAGIQRRPALARYAAAMFGRPSFRAADVWARLDPFKLIKQVSEGRAGQSYAHHRLRRSASSAAASRRRHFPATQGRRVDKAHELRRLVQGAAHVQRRPPQRCPSERRG